MPLLCDNIRYKGLGKAKGGMRRLVIGIVMGLLLATRSVAAAPVVVVAAENFYGDMARQIGGPDVTVASILSNPNQDPHLFEASTSTARAIADAALVIYNGADYDPWAAKLLQASPSASRSVIEVAALLGRKPGDNPHLWYDPATAPKVGQAIAAALAHRDPAHAGAYAARLAEFQRSLQPLAARIAALRAKYAGTPVTATEPVFQYMADALGLTMRNARFQLAVMNDTEPGAGDIAAFERDLKSRAVKALIFNNQTGEALTERMRTLAGQSHVPVVGVSETEPEGQTYQQWMLSQLDALDQALAQP